MDESEPAQYRSCVRQRKQRRPPIPTTARAAGILPGELLRGSVDEALGPVR